jgi:hypothetical protein
MERSPPTDPRSAGRGGAGIVKRHRLPVHRDARGALIAIENEALAFAPVRTFVVTDSAGAPRGDHLVPCRQTMLLVNGTVTVTASRNGESHTEVLTEPGEAVDLEPGEYVLYRLADTSSMIVVFADRPYRPAS